MNYGAPERAILVAKTVVCGTLNDNPNTSNTDLIARVTDATNWPMLNAAYFTGAAIEAYCPSYAVPRKPGFHPALTRYPSDHQQLQRDSNRITLW